MFSNRALERANNDPTKRLVEIPGYPGAYVVIDLDHHALRVGIYEARKNKARRRVWGPFAVVLEEGA